MTAARIIRGNALALPLADASVDLVVTSPPYFGLRSYQDGGEHYDGQIGAEPTPAEFVDALIKATAEMVRVLKPSGSIWLNLGDKYAGGGSGPQGKTGQRIGRSSANEPYNAAGRSRGAGVRDKSLIGIPWRYAIRCIDELGLILRAEVIWAKPNGLPESVTDRVRRSHETWLHFTKEPRYFSAVDEIREAHSENAHARRKDGGMTPSEQRLSIMGDRHGDQGFSRSAQNPNPLGKLPGSVWTIPTQPLKVPPELGIDHFAAFPMEFPRRIIQGWSPVGVCSACGEGWRPVSVGTKVPHYAGGSKGARNGMRRQGTANDDDALPRTNTLVTITGYSCACDSDGYRSASGLPLPPTIPAVVLDPFGGTGTTALMAKALGRIGISVDMSADYCRLAEWRTTNPGQMAAALQVEKPEMVHPDQMDLFADL